MLELILKKLECSFQSYLELVDCLSSDELKQKLGTLPSNTIGQQIWCVSGARESYAMAIAQNKTFEWKCTLDWNSCHNVDSLKEHLDLQSKGVRSALSHHATLSDFQLSYAIDLLAHEFQHLGQLIRYLYGNKLTIPKSWKANWHL